MAVGRTTPGTTDPASGADTRESGYASPVDTMWETAPGDVAVEADLAAVEDDLPGAVTADLRAYLAGKSAACSAVAEEVRDAADDLVRFVLDGGKRLRPTFAWWGWRGADGAARAADGTGPAPAAVLRAVSALELVQGCALVHDDLIDDSATRRGEPTVHARWERRHRERGWIGPPQRLGAAVAILLGDISLAWADDMLRDADLGPAAVARAAPVWAAMRTEVLAGQLLDVFGHATDTDDPEATLRISRYKTAAYTVERPLHLGAVLAGASDDVVAALRRFGTDIGIAFQLRDDLLGVFGDPDVTGKPAGDDLREGKRTLLVALARRSPDRTAAAAVEDALGDPALDPARLDAARRALYGSGVVAEVEARITALTASAQEALDSVPLAAGAPRRLADLAVRATRRNR